MIWSPLAHTSVLKCENAIAIRLLIPTLPLLFVDYESEYSLSYLWRLDRED